MLIWSGKGIFVPLIVIVSIVITLMFFDLVSFQGNDDWKGLAFMLLSALLIYLLGRSIDKNKGQVLLDPESGEEVLLKENHTFFFIPVKYWSYIILAFAALVGIGQVFGA